VPRRKRIGRRRNERLRLLVKKLWEEGYATPKDVWLKLREMGLKYSRSYIRSLVWTMRQEGELRPRNPLDALCATLDEICSGLDAVSSAIYFADRELGERVIELRSKARHALKLAYSLRGGR